MTFRDQLAALGYDSYPSYLKGSEWRETRERFYDSRLFKDGCQACLAKSNLNIHHMSYARLGHESLNDLVALCRDCHQAVHALEKELGMELLAATRVFIKAMWLATGRRPKHSGQWSARFQRRVAQQRAHDKRFANPFVEHWNAEEIRGRVLAKEIASEYVPTLARHATEFNPGRLTATNVIAERRRLTIVDPEGESDAIVPFAGWRTDA